MNMCEGGPNFIMVADRDLIAQCDNGATRTPSLGRARIEIVDGRRRVRGALRQRWVALNAGTYRHHATADHGSRRSTDLSASFVVSGEPRRSDRIRASHLREPRAGAASAI
jgi:hypothetical protein